MKNVSFFGFAGLLQSPGGQCCCLHLYSQSVLATFLSICVGRLTTRTDQNTKIWFKKNMVRIWFIWFSEQHFFYLLPLQCSQCVMCCLLKAVMVNTI
jgi:hypothetical protein